jgi:hypothetical protein
MGWKYAVFPLLLMLLVLFIPFFVHFLNFFNGYEISMKFCAFNTLIAKKFF